jgi:oxygen-independent coproporphyrinogen-3 oxidase
MSLVQTQLDAARAFVERNVSERQVNKILHSFPSPKLWREPSAPVYELLTQRRPRAASRRLALYVGMPYCLKTEPDRCGYCLFPVEVYTGNPELERYAEILDQEIANLGRQVGETPVHSLYFGGGTSNLYRADRYGKLMESVRSTFRLAPDAVVTLEGIPQLFTREKLLAAREAGMNRISMGAQQLNDELNRLSGRKQTVEHVLRTIEWCAELGLPCNVDLIFGWPRQTVTTMLQDLERLVATGVHHITHYELNVGGPTDFALNRRHELPSVLENLEMYQQSRDFLRSQGFRQLTAYDWERGEQTLYEECSRDFSSDLLGLGYAAVSALEGGDGTGWLWRHLTSVPQYASVVGEGRAPVGEAFHQAPEDLRLSRLFSALQGMAVDRLAYRAAYGLDLVDEHAHAWQVLEERGWVEMAPSTVRLVGDGVFYTPLVQTLLSRERIATLTASMRARRLE